MNERRNELNLRVFKSCKKDLKRLLDERNISQEWIKEISPIVKHLLKEQFQIQPKWISQIIPMHNQPYSGYRDFCVEIGSRITQRNLKDFFKKIEGSLAMWLSPTFHQMLGGKDVLPVNIDFKVSSFSFGTILDGTEYVLFNGRHHLESLVSFSVREQALSLYFKDSYKIEQRVIDSLYSLEQSWLTDMEKRIVVCHDKTTKSKCTRLYFQLIFVPRISEGQPWVDKPDKRNHKTEKKVKISQINLEDILSGDTVPFWQRINTFPRCYESLYAYGNCTTMEITIDASESHDNILDFLWWSKKYFGVEVSYCKMSYSAPSPESVWPYLLMGKDFDTQWALKTLESRGYQVIETINRHPEFVERVGHSSTDDLQKEHLLKAIYELTSLIDNDRYVDLMKAFENFLSIGYKGNKIEYKEFANVKSVVITPTRQIFYKPMPVKSNRILRNFDPAYCLRVLYRDDDMTKIAVSSGKFCDLVVWEHISKSFEQCGRKFEFLACSNSQLRSHTMWFYAYDGSFNSACIRKWMGDLSNIKNAALYVSRMGQCFTDTEPGLQGKLDESWIKYIADVEAHGYCFSDGTGMISMELADLVAKNMNKRRYSLYQIRFGGCKGTVALNPDLEGKQLVIRESMKKFESDNMELEICKGADACRLHLNHESIMLMDQRGVPPDIFLNLQREALFELLAILVDEEKAAHMLGSRTQTGIDFKLLISNGISLISEPFFQKLLLLVLETSLYEIKTKARIALPFESSRNMMGAMDETGTLAYGQVFIRYSTDMTRTKASVHVGDVIVTKFPAVHIGDMRHFEAVDVPQLYHMLDCIVFPSRGPRPHPNEMAGSDLDGDEFFVTWLPDLVDNFPKENEEAMNYENKKKEYPSAVSIEDIYKYITKYIQNDNLGRISNALKVFGDMEAGGLRSKKCIELAKMASKAVDFPKTEKPVHFNKGPDTYPDFMEKQSSFPVHISERVLGVMYRMCNKLSYIVKKTMENPKLSSFPVKFPVTDISQEMREQAIDAYRNYCNGLTEIKNTYGVDTEEELISGNIKCLHKHMSDRQDLYSTKEIITSMIKQYRRHFRSLFFDELGIVDPQQIEKVWRKADITEEMRRKAFSWYAVTRENKDASRFVSFPWIVYDILAEGFSHDSQSTDQVTEYILSNYDRCLSDVISSTESESKGKDLIKPEIYELGQKHPLVVMIFVFLYKFCEKNKVEFSDLLYKMLKFLSKKFLLQLPKFLVSGIDLQTIPD